MPSQHLTSSHNVRLLFSHPQLPPISVDAFGCSLSSISGRNFIPALSRCDMKKIHNLTYKIIIRLIADLKEREGNPRLHNRKQLKAISASIGRFGITNPILVDQHGVIVAGHGRVRAARELGITEVPTLCLSHLTPAELNAYVIADNRTAELATWDRELLAESIASIEKLDPSFDISITGFECEEIDLLRDYRSGKKAAKEVEIPRPSTLAISRVGDIWEIDGRHQVLCADATDPASYALLLPGERVDLMISDPPWNCPINGHVSRGGRHREFVAAAGELTREEFARFLSAFMVAAVRHSRSGSVHYIFTDWRILQDLLTIGEGHYDQLLNLAVWVKSNAGLGSFLRSQHELVAIFKKGKRSPINNVNLGASGRHRTNVWQHPGANTFGPDRDEALAMHPTVKPTAMIAEAIKETSHKNDLVLDPFGGSGTTLIACQQTERRARIMELDPLYVDVIIKRAEREGMKVVHSASRQSLAEVQIIRDGSGK